MWTGGIPLRLLEGMRILLPSGFEVNHGPLRLQLYIYTPYVKWSNKSTSVRLYIYLCKNYITTRTLWNRRKQVQVGSFFKVHKNKRFVLFWNFQIYDLSWVYEYINCIHKCGLRWLGLRFIFTLIWLHKKKYRSVYKLTKKGEKKCSENLVAFKGM